MPSWAAPCSSPISSAPKPGAGTSTPSPLCSEFSSWSTPLGPWPPPPSATYSTPQSKKPPSSEFYVSSSSDSMTTSASTKSVHAAPVPASMWKSFSNSILSFSWAKFKNVSTPSAKISNPKFLAPMSPFGPPPPHPTSSYFFASPVNRPRVNQPDFS